MIERTETKRAFVAETFAVQTDAGTVVRLAQVKKRTDYSPAEARQLAAELIAEADVAEHDDGWHEAEGAETLTELAERNSATASNTKEI